MKREMSTEVCAAFVDNNIRNHKSINPPGKYWYSQGTRPQTKMTIFDVDIYSTSKVKDKVKQWGVNVRPLV